MVKSLDVRMKERTLFQIQLYKYYVLQKYYMSLISTFLKDHHYSIIFVSVVKVNKSLEKTKTSDELSQ